jgi:hypothetical protein
VTSPCAIFFTDVAAVVKTMPLPGTKEFTEELLLISSSAELVIALSEELVVTSSEELLFSAVAFGMVVEPAEEGLSEEQAARAQRANAPAI